MMHRVVYCCFICIVLSCTFVVIVESLIGEKVRNVEVGEFPFVVSIALKNPKINALQSHFCTGVVISRANILTAAHCFVEAAVTRLVNESDIQVKIGSVDLFTARNYNVRRWITYNEWAPDHNEILTGDFIDIAILTLLEFITERHVYPVRLSSLNVEQTKRSRGFIAGFGGTESTVVSRFLLTAVVNILSSDECNHKFYLFTNLRGFIPENEICSTAEPYALLTRGDSGGPILNQRKELVGINLATCPKDTWYQECRSEQFLQKYRMNTHLTIDFYRTFIEGFQ